MLLLATAVVCAQCHAGLVARWAQSPMARSSGAVHPAEEFAGRFRHENSGTEFRIDQRGESLELTWLGHAAVLSFFVGSRRMGRSYLISEDGYLYQAPVGYYSARKSWDMAPGYERDREPDLSRPVTADCLFCHATGARAVEGTLNRIADPAALHGIGCERCHGRSEEHTFVNPAKLPPAARDSVCEQCHLSGAVRLTLPGRRLEDFRPGELLSDYLEVFVDAARAPGVRVNGHAEALAASRCRRASGDKLACITCHDPHQPASTFRDKCVGCHRPESCPSPARDRQDCTACHMPKARAYDGGHTTFTDHSIPRRKPTYGPARPPSKLARYYERRLPAWIESRNLGLAYAQLASIDQAWPLLREAAAAQPDDPALYAQIAALLQADGRTEQAAAYYERCLKLDANNYAALRNLAGLLERRGDKARAAALRAKLSVLLPRSPVRR